MRFLFPLLAALWSLSGLIAAEQNAIAPVELSKVVASDAAVRKLGGDMKFLEGPAWTNANGGYLLFSDIPSNQIKKWTASDGISTYREPSHNSNGNIFDTDGTLVTCHHSARAVTRTLADGTVATLVDSYDGKKLNSPNDVAITKAGIIYFTDPSYGVKPPAVKEQAGQYVYRFDPASKNITAVITDIDMPNGIVFSPDEKLLYVADSGKTKNIFVYDVLADGNVGPAKVFAHIDQGSPDGIRMDTQGRLWSSAKDGVRIFLPDGTHIGTILTPESPANLCFGGSAGKTLFITARKSLYAIDVLVGDAHAR